MLLNFIVFAGMFYLCFFLVSIIQESIKDTGFYEKWLAAG